MMEKTRVEINREEEEEENENNSKNGNGGPTKLPAKGGGQQQRPGKVEPLVGWEAGRNQRQPSSMLEPVLGGVYSPSVVAPPG